MVTKLPKKQQRLNAEILEDLYTGAENFARFYEKRNVAEAIVEVIPMLAAFGPKVTISEIREAQKGYFYWEECTLAVLTELHALWVDKEHFIQREDNLLTPPAGPNPHWRKSFEHEAVKVIAQKGGIVAHRESSYNWEEYFRPSQPIPEVIAAFNFREKEWEEFNGTFASNSSHVGLEMDVLLSDGQFRVMRYETELGDFMRELS